MTKPAKRICKWKGCSFHSHKAKAYCCADCCADCAFSDDRDEKQLLKQQKREVARLKSLFTLKGIKKGDLVFTGQIHRVVSTEGMRRTGLTVVDVVPQCEAECCRDECSHTHYMGVGFGQHRVMKLKSNPC